MANTIKLKKSSQTGNAPSDLELGEVALNYADGNLYYKNTSNAIDILNAKNADTLDGQHGSYYQPASTALTTSTTFGGDVSGPYNNIVVADDSHTHDTRYYTESEVQTFLNRSYISSENATNLAVGWYTIATNTGNRASARFGIWDTTGGRHQSVTFYAAHHYGTDASNTLTVLDNAYYSGNPFRYIRIKDGGTYDGAALQVYIDDSSNDVFAAILGDNFQSSGWVLRDWIPDATTPPDVDNYGSFAEVAKVDLDTIAQGGFATTGPIYADGDLAQYKVLTTADEGSGNGLDADTLDGSQKNTLVASLRANHNITGGGTITYNSSGYIKNSGRFIVISNGRGSHFSTNGYFDINIPTSGTITGVGGASNRTATSDGIQLNGWEALYYILPIGSNSGTIAANFRVCSFQPFDVEIPETWVLVAIRNGDSNQKCYVIGKYALEPGESIDTTVYDAKNADLLDGQHGSYYAAASSINGTDNYIPRFNGTSALENSIIYDDGTNIGIGTAIPGYKLEVNGSFAATTKSFIIDHPTKEGKKLRYASLEGPENGVYIRGKSGADIIELPEYWEKLVENDSITVTLTPIGKFQPLYVISQDSKKIEIGGVEGEYNYVIYGERIDVEKLIVEVD